MTWREQRSFNSRMRSMRQMAVIPGQFWSRREGSWVRTAMRRVSMRPWPFSTVWARFRSGGSRRSVAVSATAATTARGGNVTEGSFELGFQFRLVGLHEQEVVAAALSDRLDDGLEREGGIAGDHCAVERQRLDQLQRLDHLAAVG